VPPAAQAQTGQAQTGEAQTGEAQTGEDEANLPARLGQERLGEPVIRTGMFGVQDTPDTSGFGLLRVHQVPPIGSLRPYGSYFDAIADALSAGLEAAGVRFSDAIERVVVDRGELTFHVRRERLPEVAAEFRDDPAYPLARRRVPDLQLARAGDLGLLRHHLRRPSGPDQDRNAGRLEGPPAAQGLPARRHPG
jgi:hypothetical protein